MKKATIRTVSFLLCIILTLCSCVLPASAAGNPFTDVSTSDSYYEAITFVYDNNLMSGTTPTKFNPTGNITRGAFISVLGRLAEQLGETISSSYNHPYTDVPASEYYAKYVGWAWKNNITSGTSTTTFSPNRTINREQMASIIMNFCSHMDIELVAKRNYNIDDLSSASSWARNAIQATCNAMVVPPAEDKSWLIANLVIFGPKDTITRAICAQTIYNLVSIQIS